MIQEQNSGEPASEDFLDDFGYQKYLELCVTEHQEGIHRIPFVHEIQ